MAETEFLFYFSRSPSYVIRSSQAVLVLGTIYHYVTPSRQGPLSYDPKGPPTRHYPNYTISTWRSFHASVRHSSLQRIIVIEGDVDPQRIRPLAMSPQTPPEPVFSVGNMTVGWDLNFRGIVKMAIFHITIFVAWRCCQFGGKPVNDII